MARVQQQGISAITIWMLVFVVLWLASTVTLVILYTGQDGLRAENLRLRDERNKAVSANEERSISIIAGASVQNTMVGLMEKARATTADLATGNAADLPEEVRSKRNQILDRIRQSGYASEPNRYSDTSLLNALTLLFGEFSTKSAQLAEQQEHAKSLEDQVAELTRQNSALKADFAAQAKELGERMVQLEEARAQFGEEKEGQVDTLREQMEERQVRADRDLAQERERRSEVEAKLAELRTRFDDLQEKCGALQMSPDPLAPARTPDGKILVAVPGDPVVYINLGRRDRLTLGLQFAVYSAETGIPADGKSKARIEVVSMTDVSAECKVLSVDRNAIILSGDLIANPVYDANRSLTFFVAGEFDLNRDGRPDARGTDAVKAMVQQWGGTVVDELTAMTDFVVVGTSPRTPREGDEPFVKQRYDQYLEAVGDARSLSLPMMTQASFLSFLGYADRF